MVGYESHPTAIFVGRAHPHHRSVRIVIPRLDRFEALQETSDNVATLSVDHDVCRADPGPAAVGGKVPHGAGLAPTVRPKFVGIRAPKLYIAMHQEPVAVHDVALGTENGLHSALSPAARERRILDASPNGLEADRVQAVALTRWPS